MDETQVKSDIKLKNESLNQGFGEENWNFNGSIIRKLKKNFSLW